MPVLIVLALLLVVFGPRLTAAWPHGPARAERTRSPRCCGWSHFGTGVYGGYFGAAQGVLLMGFSGCSSPSRCSGRTP